MWYRAGKGEPSARFTFWLKLTNDNAGATIRLADTTAAATYSLFLFTLEPPGLQNGQDSRAEILWLKKFCLRNNVNRL